MRSRYDFYYALSPPSSASNYYDNHNGSLFGDPVPPPPAGFLENLDSYLYGNLRRGSSAMASFGSHQLSEFSASDFRRASASNLTESEITSEHPVQCQTSSSSSDHLFGNLTGAPTKGMRSPTEWLSYKTAAEEWRSSFPRIQSARNVSEVNHGSAMTALILPDTSSSSGAATHVESTPEPHRTEFPSIPDTQIASATTSDNTSDVQEAEEPEMVLERTNGVVSPSPAIITDKITTGPYRIPDTRSGTKRSAFAIISQLSSLSPNVSRADSPDGHIPGRFSPFRGYGFRDMGSLSSSRAISPKSKSLENFLNPQSIYGSRRPSFDILESLPREMESYQISTDVRHKTMIKIASSSSTSLHQDFRNRSYEALDRAPRARSGLSASESMKHLGRPILRRRSSSGNSTRLPVRSRSSLQRGVVRVMSQNETGSPSRIPRPRTSIGCSMDDMGSRRESSVSPLRKPLSRRSSRRLSASNLQPAVTLLDASPLPRERSSRSPRRPGVLKVTPLSPIIGTPNKEAEVQEEVKTMSPSRIPVRSNSISQPIARSNTTLGVSTTNQKTETLAASRHASPGKSPGKVTSKSPSKKPQKPPVKCHEGKKAPVTRKPPIVGGVNDKKAVIKTTRKIETVSKVKKVEAKPVSKTPSFRKDITNGNVKKEPTSTRKGPSLVKKEPSSARQESRGRVSRENSGISRNKVPPKLEKKPSFRAEKAPAKVMEQESVESEESVKTETSESPNKFDKLIPLTKNNVVSMTTAAIASQPVQITTTLTNQLSTPKITEEAENKDIHPAAILEKSQKTLETIKKTVNDATEEIHKTITENLTEFKTLEQDIQKAGECAKEETAMPKEKPEKPPMAKKESSRKLREVCEKIASEAAVVDKMSQDGRKTPKETLSKQPSSQTLTKATMPEVIPEIENNNNEEPKEMPPVDVDVSVVETNNNNPVRETVNNNLGDGASEEKISERAISALPEVELESGNFEKSHAVLPEVIQVNPEAAKSTNGDGSPGETAEESSVKESKAPSRCSRCSTCCLPCGKILCCRKQTKDSEPSPVPPADSLETVNEKSSRWNCCKGKNKNKEAKEEKIEKKRAKKTKEVAPKSDEESIKSQNCCRACLNRVLCCRSTNKIDSHHERMLEPDQQTKSKCCSCLPCRRQRKKSDASTASTWAERQLSDPPLEPKPPGCCSRFWRCLCCCCCRRKEDPESRRTSLNSKKASIAPPPPVEKSKLDLSLVEHSSLMKAAIPVMHICLAWFCLICNCLVPGLGTIFSGFFCLCLGTPRFSQHDGFRARIGTFLINIIVGVAQAFTVLFCLVGWGWSIWWGTIMVRLARKRKKLRKAQRDEEAAEAATISSRSQAPVLPAAGASPAPPGATENSPAVEA